MKKIKLILVLCGLVVTTFAQKTGIKFRDFDNWEAVLAASKKENKAIFVDIFTTWCTPCKEMEYEVYPNEEVAEYFNKNYISVKVQMDKTAKDSEQIKKWYSEHAQLNRTYGIMGYPTFLFVSSDGLLLNKATGYQRPSDFIKTAAIALNPGQKYVSPTVKYYEAILAYKQGRKSGAYLVELIDELILHTPYFSEKNQVIDSLGNTYLSYLHDQPFAKLYIKEALVFLGRVGLKTTDPLFALFYKNEAQIDKIVGKKNFGRQLVDRAIARDYFDVLLKSYASGKAKSEPDWDSLYTLVKVKFNPDYASRAVEAAKIPYYFYTLTAYQNDSLHKYDHAYIGLIKKYGNYSTLIYPLRLVPHRIDHFELEQYEAWGISVFCNEQLWKQSDNPEHLKFGIKLMEGINDFINNRMQGDIKKEFLYDCSDAYANLLHKVGDTQKGIEILLKAIEIGKSSKYISKDYIEGYEKMLELMRSGKPTWYVAPKANFKE